MVIGSVDQESAMKAEDMILGLTKEVEVGETYDGKVVRIMNFGAFVEILPGKDGMVHISELSDRRVESVEDVVSVGDQISVLVTEIDSLGRVNLSRRALLERDTESGPNSEGRKSSTGYSKPGGDSDSRNRDTRPPERRQPRGNRPSPRFPGNRDRRR